MKKPGSSSAGKAGLGSFGKSALGSTGKTGVGSTSKSGSVLGSSGKSSLGSTSKSGLGYTSQSAKPSSKSGINLISKSASPKPSKSFDFIPSGKPTSLTPLSSKNYPSSSNDGYGNPKNAKSSTTFGIIWIPTKKRNKKKDIVLNSNNDTHRVRERSPSFYKL